MRAYVFLEASIAVIAATFCVWSLRLKQGIHRVGKDVCEPTTIGQGLGKTARRMRSDETEGGRRGRADYGRKQVGAETSKSARVVLTQFTAASKDIAGGVRRPNPLQLSPFVLLCWLFFRAQRQ